MAFVDYQTGPVGILSINPITGTVTPSTESDPICKAYHGTRQFVIDKKRHACREGDRWGPLNSGVIEDIDYPFELVGDDDYYQTLNFSQYNYHFGSFGFTSANIFSNGLVQFDGATGGRSYTMPNLTYGGYKLAPYWADHDTYENAGAMRYGIVDIGQLVLAVFWDNVAIYGSDHSVDKRCEFQLIMYQDGTFEYNYGRIENDLGSASGSAGPIVGYYLPNSWLWEHPGSHQSLPRTIGDPDYGPDYLLQGTSGFTTGGEHSLEAIGSYTFPL